MEDEIWKIVPNYEKYEASNLGLIRIAKTKEIRKLQKKNGYYRLNLMNNESKKINVFVHRMIGFAFIPNTNNHPTINHINKNRLDNSVINLEWASQLEQNQPENRLAPKQHITGARSVNRIDSETDEILQTYESSAEAGRWVVAEGLTKSNRSPASITVVCRGKQKTAYGFSWSYVQDEVIYEDIWKLLPPSLIHGAEGCFVSNKGRIRNNKGKISSGYAECGVIKVSVSSKIFCLHRLVASVFIPNPDNLPYVINSDEDIHNNCVENLRWVPFGYRHQSNGLRSLV
jgi:hypothetical protein